jgi:cytidylate kinase
MSQGKYSIIITGEWPGAGQSTTAKLLAHKLQFDRVYAGFLMRKFAQIWHQESKRLHWQEFESKVINKEIDFSDYHFHESEFQERTLHTFQYQLQKVGTPDLWDKIIDLQSLVALKRPGVVVEAKVGVLLDQTKLIKLGRLSHRIYKILLTCPPEISSHRVIKRKIENKELPAMDQDHPRYLDLIRETTTETINRHLRDWERYEKIYGIYRSSIYKPGIIKVNTAERDASEVVGTIMNIIQQKEGQRRLTHPA